MNNQIFLEVTPNNRNSLSCINRLTEKGKERSTKENYKCVQFLLNMGQMYFKNSNGLCHKNLHKWILYPWSTLYPLKYVTCWDKSIKYVHSLHLKLHFIKITLYFSTSLYEYFNIHFHCVNEKPACHLVICKIHKVSFLK